MTNALLTTKFFPPPPRDHLVARPRLVERLGLGLEQGRKLVLISAPAGFGKTTLVVDACCRLTNYPTAWLSLDAADNDLVRFWRYMIAALRRVTPEVGQLALDMLNESQPPPIETVLTGLLNDLVGVEHPLLLVLDDYHVIETPAIHTGLNFLLDHLPPQMRLVITTRADPPLALARRRSRMEMLEVRATDLRFTREESLQFLNISMRLGLSAQDVDVLLRRTEGWAAGLQMAALAMQSITPADEPAAAGLPDALHAFVTTFAGDDQYVGDYLVEEVLQRQPEAVQEFLLLTAVLERFNADLCGQVLSALPGRIPLTPAQAREMLEMLDHSNLFLVPLDNRQEWFRYHRLFAELLLRRMRQVYSTEVETQLHQQASRWFEANHFWDEAFEHAMLAKDVQRAGEMVVAGWAEMFVSSQLNTVLNWARRLPREQIYCDPTLGMICSWVSLATGHVGDTITILDELEKRLNISVDQLKDGPQALLALPRALMTTLMIMAVQRSTIFISGLDVPRGIALCQDIITCMTAISAQDTYKELLPYETVPYYNLGMVYEAEGRVEEASRYYADAITLSRKYGNLHILTMSVGHLAQLRSTCGRLPEAMEIYRESMQVTTELTGRPSVFIGVSYAGMGHIHYEWNALEDASNAFEQAITIARPWNNWETLVSAGVGLARARFARQDLPGALATLDEMDARWQEMYHGGPLPIFLGWRALLTGETRRIPEVMEALDHPDEWLMRANVFYSLDRQQILKARLLLMDKKYLPARDLMHDLAASMAVNGQHGIQLQAFVLESSALLSLGDSIRAQAVLEQALQLAEPGGYLRIFLDEGLPLARLLLTIATAKEPSAMGRYAARVLEAVPANGQNLPPTQPNPSTNLPKALLVEPISDREVEVLRLLAEGLSNTAIAARLVISPGTVKVHTSNIYGKLAVNSRSAAVAKARALGIIR